MTEQAAIPAEIETSFGKGASDEYFPVASCLISPALRPHVMNFYAFARAADDIADSPALTESDKLARLGLFEAGLSGTGAPKAVVLARSLSQVGVSDQHARDLLNAFRQDAVARRHNRWEDLIGYCALSANPVGHFLLDLHGEDRFLYRGADALCTVLQILNHIQDCAADYADLDRVYLPLEMLAEEGLKVDVLSSPASPPGLRRVFDLVLKRCEALLYQSAGWSAKMRSRRLRAETAAITSLAWRLIARLRQADPLADQIGLTALDKAWAGVRGIAALSGRGFA
ncbi:MAG: squalene/phytoene synthase family protein [Pseudomonadota bacterium]